jgi:HAD superfamily hydrolase (TIGR01509 family)
LSARKGWSIHVATESVPQAFVALVHFSAGPLIKTSDTKDLSGIETVGALIFDFDGVIADSEAIANTVLAEIVTELGHPTTLDQALTRYSGRRWDDAMAEIESAIGRSLPADFSGELKRATLDRFRTDLKEVSGAANFIKRFSHLPRCIASSSSIDRLRLCLAVLALEGEFGDRVFSADMVARGKPHPDIFLFAAGKLGVSPDRCLVIEDSVGGIKAAVAAGMTTVGLCAASHIRAGHDVKLRDAGAMHLAQSWADVERFALGFFRMRG